LKLLLLKKGPNTVVTQSELAQIYAMFLKIPAAQRMKRLNLKADRVDVLEPALFLTLSLMKKYHIKRIKIPGVGLKEGAILSLL
jgi:exopolyphosphatase / guanosine-5'-triphosphate,3'-diphosphate pyrophosphatase